MKFIGKKYPLSPKLYILPEVNRELTQFFNNPIVSENCLINMLVLTLSKSSDNNPFIAFIIRIH